MTNAIIIIAFVSIIKSDTAINCDIGQSAHASILLISTSLFTEITAFLPLNDRVTELHLQAIFNELRYLDKMSCGYDIRINVS